MRAREESIDVECADCHWLAFCRGGCPYNALAAGDGSLDAGRRRDPYCAAYRRTFKTIVDRATAEVFSPENLAKVVERPDAERGLLRRGRLLSIMGSGPHPYETATRARRLLAAVALATSASVTEAVDRFAQLGLAGNRGRTEAAMAALQARLTAPTTGLNNLYLHVTFACNLRCAHCYAQAGAPRLGSLSVAGVAAATRQASGLGFRHVVVTGGEPLLHPQPAALLDALAALRNEVKPLLTVLRTALAFPLGGALLARLAHSTDEVVVSLDGDRATHDARRGVGTYDVTVANLRALLAAGGDSEVSLAAVLPITLVNGAPGDSVRALAAELGIRRTRFRPLLPLGRALDSELEIVPTAAWSRTDPRDMVAYGFSPLASCGLGQNLYVEPDGAAYPCYAWHGEDWRLGSLDGAGGLDGVITSAAFRALGAHTVNTNRACRACSLRYLCGGACRAWNDAAHPRREDLDVPPVDCRALHARARSLLDTALEQASVAAGDWLAAGLPLPDTPPAPLPDAAATLPDP